MTAAAEPRPATYREVLGVAEFRALYAANLLSALGDQIARIALALLVFERSESPLLAALSYAVTYLPWIIGGPVLSPLADRLPRRRVMIACDVFRALLVGSMALPDLPLWSLFVLLLTASVLTPPFDAARAATVPDVLEGDRYVVGSSLTNITNQLVQVIGFATGGAVVAAVGARGTLLFDALTFAVSAVLLWWGVRQRPAADPGGRPRLVADTVEGARTVFGDPVLRAILLLAWVGAAFAVVPEGLAVAYAQSLGKGDVATGFLTAAIPAGVVVGAVVIGRLVAPARRLRLILPLAVLTFVPLTVTFLHPPVVWACALWAVTGVGMAFQLPANAAFVAALPAASRGRAFGLAQSGLQVFQGIALAGAGALAEVVPVEVAVGAAGVAGLAGTLLLASRWPFAAIEAVTRPGTAAVPLPTPLPVQPLGAPRIAAAAPPVDRVDPAAAVAPAPPRAAPLPPAPAYVELSWSGPYQLAPAPRELRVRLVPLDE